MDVELEQVIAMRRLRVGGSDDLDVRLLIGLPRPFPDDPNGDYLCPYQITGVGDEKVRYAAGVDALQALELALQILPVQLDVLRTQHPGLRWEDAPAGDYGFSEAISAAYRRDEG
ncbi:MAG: hypothetical protein AAGA56_18200 [Myxococcota bacterium]